MPIALADLLMEQQVILRLRSRKPANAIREIVDVLASDISGRKIAKPEAFLEQVFAREQTHPSVVEDGVVLPHAHTIRDRESWKQRCAEREDALLLLPVSSLSHRSRPCLRKDFLRAACK